MGTRVQIGRHVKVIPERSGTREQFASQVSERERAAKELRDVRARNEELWAQVERFEFSKNLEEIALLNIKELKLKPLDAEKLGNTLNAALEKWVKAGKPLKANKATGQPGFDPYAVISKFKERLGRALPLAPRNGSRPESLPAPAQEGRIAPNDQASHAAKAQAQKEKNERRREEIMRDREAYSRRLRELGLTDPNVGFPGSGRSGLGY
jgi:hypothetical protein